MAASDGLRHLVLSTDSFRTERLICFQSTYCALNTFTTCLLTILLNHFVVDRYKDIIRMAVFVFWIPNYRVSTSLVCIYDLDDFPVLSCSLVHANAF